MEVLYFKLPPDTVSCRLCFSNKENFRKFESTSDCEDIKKSFGHLVQKHLHITIFELNYQVCEECYQKLLDFENFYKKVHKEVEKQVEKLQLKLQKETSIIKSEPPDDPLHTGTYPENKENPFEFYSNVKIEPTDPFNPQEEAHCNDSNNVTNFPLQSSTQHVTDPLKTDTLKITTLKKKKRKLTFEELEELQKDEDFDPVYDKELSKILQSIYLDNIPKLPDPILVNDTLVVKGMLRTTLHKKFFKLECNRCEDKTVAASLGLLFEHHVKIHKRPGHIVCVLCPNKRIGCVTTANIHMARHIQPDLFKCNICDFMAARPSFLDNHSRTHLPAILKPYKCDICSSTFSWLSSYMDHKSNCQSKNEYQPRAAKVAKKLQQINSSKMSNNPANNKKN